MSFSLQKFAPIDREYPIYEVIDEERNVLLDVSRSDEGLHEIGFHKDCAGKVLPLDDLLSLIQQARTLLDKHEEI